MQVYLYSRSELIGIASLNADGSFAFEGTDEGRNLAAGIATADATPEYRLQKLATLDNYPYVWGEVHDGRTLLGKAIDLVTGRA